MEKTIGKPKKVKTKSGRAGSFFLGTFIGFLLTLALLAGLFSFVYFKLSADWVNKHFKTNISLPYDLNSLTLNDAVTAAINLGQNLDTYTLNKLKEDFGIKISDNLFGIDISDLKSVAFKDLSNSISNKFKSISAYELDGVISLGDVKNFLTDPKHANTYYVQGTTLFTDEDCQTAATFEYKIVDNKVQIKSFYTSDPITDGKVSIQLYYLPIMDAFSSLNFSENMKIEELEKFVTLPVFLNKIDKTQPLSELANEIEKLRIGDILGYYMDDPSGVIYKDETTMQPVSKLESTLAKETILSLKGGLNFKLGDVFDDSYFESGLLRLLSDEQSKGTTVDKLPELLDQKIKTANLNTLKDIRIFGEDAFDSGILSLLSEEERNECTILTLADTLENKVGNATLGDLVKAGIITGNNAEFIKTKKIKTTSNPDGIPLSGMQLTSFLDLLFTDSKFASLIFTE